MTDISVIVCTRNPRPDYLSRALGALQRQSLPLDQWELVLVDNASDEALSSQWDLSWHPSGRHVREDALGLTAARLRGIAETTSELIVFVDDDNVLAPDFLSEAAAVRDEYPHLGVFGAGVLEPEFEVQPAPELLKQAQMLALRTVASVQWSNNPRDSDSIPWGAGLCVRRTVADAFGPFVERMGFGGALGRKGDQLFAGEDDLFSWVAASRNRGFGVFPRLRITHLIAKTRLTRPYFTRLIRDHAFSHGVLGYVLSGTKPRRIDWLQCVQVVLHGVRNGVFSAQCRWASARGADRAARLVVERRLHTALPEPVGELDR